MMTHRDRLMAIFEFEETDRVPRDLGSTIWSTMDAKSYGNLKRHIEYTGPDKYKNLGFQAVEIDEEILQLLDIDTRGLTTRGPTGWVDHISEGGLYIDEWGIERDVNTSASITFHPFATDLFDHDFLASYPWPDGTDPGRFAGFEYSFRSWHLEGEYSTVLNIFGGFTTMSYLLRGLDNWCVDMLLDEDLFEDLLDRTFRFEIDSARAALSVLGPYVDIVAIADDFAGQDGMLFSPDHFRKFIKPRMARLILAIKELCSSKILFHNCGAIADIIPDLIEIGVDALNPFQVTAKGMAPNFLKQKYHGKMVFWGGIDTQRLLPYGSPQEVTGEVARISEIMAKDGGYVLAAVHNIQGDVPPENVLALFNGIDRMSTGFV